MATVMKGLRTPRGDAGGGVYWGEGRVMVRGMRGGQKLKAKRRKKPQDFFFFVFFIVLFSALTVLRHIM